MAYKKKLIEVTLPLEAINKESAREKSIRHGHPSTLHLWWARRPLAACRAVLFSSLVDDPSAHPDKFPTEEDQQKERLRLFNIIEELVKWENINNETVLNAAKKEIMKSTDGNPPPVYDPFCGGGSIPLEAQRLGLEAHGSDLNPVAVLITKALIEIPPKFANMQPVRPKDANAKQSYEWKGAQGLAEDVRYYGQWMRDEAFKRIGHLYPKVKIPTTSPMMKETEATVIAWLWARTVKCPNPACGAEMPLVRSFALSTKAGKKAWVEPVIDRSTTLPKIDFVVKSGNGEVPESPKTGRGANFKCLSCGQPASSNHIKAEGVAGRMDSQLMAIVAEGQNGRIYLPPSDDHSLLAKEIVPDWFPEGQISDDKRSMFTPLYGLTHFHHLFTPRQLVALTTFSDLVKEAREKVLSDARKAGMKDAGKGINEGGTGATAYADAVATYLAFAVDKCADYWSAICSWHSSGEKMRNTFGRQAIPMVWDYAECCPFSDSTGNWMACIDWVWKVIERLRSNNIGKVDQSDATSFGINNNILFSTDPPYYDNIGYADLSDFFYIWMRRSLGEIYPKLFTTMLVPKAEELVATPYRFDGNKEKAKDFFETGLSKTFHNIRKYQNKDFPLTVYYAFKQTEDDNNDEDYSGNIIASTGWETMLEAILKAGFSIDGTWPMRTELSNRSVGLGTNALASSIVLVCRPRPEDARQTTRRDFLNELKRELPVSLKNLEQGNIAPVDLAQASIGPGMAIFSKYSRVLEADGSAMKVRTALALINQTLDEVLAEQEGQMDADTRFCIAWFEQNGMNEGVYGDAETLSRAKNTSVKGLDDAGVLIARAGKTRLLKRDEMPEDWSPDEDARLTVWECCQHLISKLSSKGEGEAAKLMSLMGSGLAEEARSLAYRLYSICERKGWASEALAYNSLVISWPELIRLSQETTVPRRRPVQDTLI